ncbi:hypothetical protein EVAR_77927_1 [Eumeta japonica]|uniref:Uncharacterized protein n=1 Tax=Eumeta variegata TaxID=151549 RepID=A0A4C1XR23_EUMVA|nr:hypothetical protein EVAR_77927_1 [Eumeta japonica]
MYDRFHTFYKCRRDLPKAFDRVDRRLLSPKPEHRVLTAHESIDCTSNRGKSEIIRVPDQPLIKCTCQCDWQSVTQWPLQYQSRGRVDDLFLASIVHLLRRNILIFLPVTVLERDMWN